MTQRFEGRYSPGRTDLPGGREERGRDPAPASHFRGRQARQVSARARLLYIAAIPMLVAAIGEIRRGDAMGMVTELGCFGLFLAAAALINEGLRAEEAYDARRVAKPPAVPRKILGSVAAGLGVGIGAAFAWGLGPLSGAVFGLVATGAALVAFGPDPMRGKGLDGIEGIDRMRATEAVDRAETVLAEMLEIARRFRDRPLEDRVEQFAATAREMFARVAEDPRDLTRTRKFMGVYLSGARDATRRYADLQARRPDPAARADYAALLDDLQASFTARRHEMLNDDRDALDIEIEVLRDRLNREGLR